MHYILDDAGNPQPCDNVVTWAQWYKKGENRRLALTEFEGARVSTVFLATDYNFTHEHTAPLLWETMVFASGLSLEEDCWRYASREEALKGHDAAVALVRDARGVDIDGLLSVSDRGALDFKFDKNVPVTSKQVGVIAQLVPLAWLLGFDAAPSFDWCEVRQHG